jgi:hypothetical protein
MVRQRNEWFKPFQRLDGLLLGEDVVDVVLDVRELVDDLILDALLDGRLELSDARDVCLVKPEDTIGSLSTTHWLFTGLFTHFLNISCVWRRL